jgi:mannitol-specific phosphotransferase system IIBC component
MYIIYLMKTVIGSKCLVEDNDSNLPAATITNTNANTISPPETTMTGAAIAATTTGVETLTSLDDTLSTATSAATTTIASAATTTASSLSPMSTTVSASAAAATVSTAAIITSSPFITKEEELQITKALMNADDEDMAKSLQLAMKLHEEEEEKSYNSYKC